MLGSTNHQYIRNLSQLIDISSDNRVILTAAFLLAGYAFVLLNPYNILNYAYLPFILFFSVIGVYLFFSIDAEIDVARFSKKLLFYVLLFTFFCIIYYLSKNVLLYMMGISLGVVFLFYVVGVAFIYSLFLAEFEEKVSKPTELFYVIKYLILYIPCVLVDIIQYSINDAKHTNKTTFILFGLLILLIIIYFIIPLVLNYRYKHDGILLISTKRYLNESILTLNLKELNDKIKNSQTLLNYAFGSEGFKSLSDNEIPTILSNVSPPQGGESLDYSFLSRLYYSILLLKNKFIYGESNSEEDIITQYKSPTLHTYHYGISFWLYLDTNMLAEKNRDKALILSLGSRPSLFYDYNKRQLIIEITDYVKKDTSFKQTRIYNSSNILFQKWNHVVMNYVNGQFDLFINNELVSTQSNVSPYINATDVLQVGTVENSDLGGISNLKYYNQPLTSNKIKEIYQQKLISLE